jgi:SAM-dependent methyltransferase
MRKTHAEKGVTEYSMSNYLIAIMRKIISTSLLAKLFCFYTVLFRGGISSNRQFLKMFYKKKGAKPLKKVPENLRDSFTLGGKIPIINLYLDNRASFQTHNTKEKYSEVFSQLEAGSFKYYGKDMLSFYDALEDYDLSGKTALVLGLAGCNCEAMALWKNAKRVYVADYNKPRCDHERITVLSMDELASSDLKVDCAFSFSSFEHDGLGRYGDPISPNADLRAMRHAKSVVKPDGILFLGVPLGRDCLIWNAQRIYGRIRLRMLLKGWLCLDAYYHSGIDFFEKPLGFYYQPLLVLRNTEASNEDILERERERERQKFQYTETILEKRTRQPMLLREILKIQMHDAQTDRSED